MSKYLVRGRNACDLDSIHEKKKKLEREIMWHFDWLNFRNWQENWLEILLSFENHRNYDVLAPSDMRDVFTHQCYVFSA